MKLTRYLRRARAGLRILHAQHGQWRSLPCTFPHASQQAFLEAHDARFSISVEYLLFKVRQP